MSHANETTFIGVTVKNSTVAWYTQTYFTTCEIYLRSMSCVYVQYSAFIISWYNVLISELYNLNAKPTDDTVEYIFSI